MNIDTITPYTDGNLSSYGHHPHGLDAADHDLLCSVTRAPYLIVEMAGPRRTEMVVLGAYETEEAALAHYELSNRWIVYPAEEKP